MHASDVWEGCANAMLHGVAFRAFLVYGACSKASCHCALSKLKFVLKQSSSHLPANYKRVLDRGLGTKLVVYQNPSRLLYFETLDPRLIT